MLSRIIKVFFAVLIILIFLILLIFAIRLIRGWKIRIKTDEGIEENIMVDIGGIKQSLIIRGEDVSNPVILFLHGGPGFPISFLSNEYQKYLEDEFTVVHWHQRNAGRTYYKNQDSDVELTMDIMLSDTDEVVDYLKERFDKDQIIILGQSWGSIIGVEYVQKHPEKVLAYVGVGQIVDFDAGKIAAVDEALEIAREKNDEKNILLLEEYGKEFSDVNTIKEVNTTHLLDMIGTSLSYLKGKEELSAFELMWKGLISPDMSFDDIRWYILTMDTATLFELEENLVDYMYFGFDMKELDFNYQVPMYFISGGNDWVTPYIFVEDIIENICAPEKELLIMEEVGHVPFLDQPEKFAENLKCFLNKENE